MTTEPFFVASIPHVDNQRAFNTHRELISWAEAEHEAWKWLWSSPTTLNQNLVQGWHQANSLLQQLRVESQNVGGEQYNNQIFVNAVNNAFRDGQFSVFPSGSVEAARIFLVRDAKGVDEARAYLELAKNRINLSSISGPTFLTLVSAASFDEEVHGEIGQSLADERRNYRGEISKLRNRVAELEREHADFLASEHSRARKLTRRLARMTAREYGMREAVIYGSFNERVASIRETEDHYRTQMALQAPVQYWRDKAKGHRSSEVAYALVCLAYFAAAGTAIAFVADAAIDYLQAFSGEHETSAYVIIAGALLGGTTLIFWLGRLLVKLFLSEHHLRSDSDEKAIMTQAFLAMGSREQSFSETERSIILASIFRSSPDGIVKEEGPGDFGANALLAKLLMR